MPFVHLRAHTEFSVVDGTLRIDEAVAAAAADGQGALAITDLSNLFGAVKFYSAARAAGVKPIIGAEVCLEPEGRRDGSRAASCCWCRTARATSTCCELLSRGWLDNAAARPGARSSGQWLVERNAGLIVLSGAEQRRDRPGARWPATTRARGRWRERLAARLRATASTSRCSATACRATRRICARRCSWRRELRAAGGRDAPGAVPRPRRPRGARGARLRRRGRDAGQPAPRQALQPRAVLQDARRRWRRCSPTCRARCANSGRDRQALQPERWCSASRSCPTSRRRWSATRRCRWPSTSAIASHEGLEVRLGQLYPDAGGARARAPALRRPGSTSRSRRS